jgi:hypothetical protein
MLYCREENFTEILLMKTNVFSIAARFFANLIFPGKTKLVIWVKFAATNMAHGFIKKRLYRGMFIRLLISAVAAILLTANVASVLNAAPVRERRWEDYFVDNTWVLKQAEKWYKAGSYGLIIRYADVLVKTGGGRSLLINAIRNTVKLKDFAEIIDQKAAIVGLPDGEKILEIAETVLLMYAKPEMEDVTMLKKTQVIVNGEKLASDVIKMWIQKRIGRPSQLSLLENSSVIKEVLLDEWSGHVKAAVEGIKEQGRWDEILKNSAAIKEALPDEWSGHVKAAVEEIRGQRRWEIILENSSAIKEALPESDWRDCIKAAAEQRECRDVVIRYSSVIKEALPDQWQGIIWIAVTEIIDAKWWGEILDNSFLIKETLPDEWSGQMKAAVEGIKEQGRWDEILKNSAAIKEALPDEWSGQIKAAVEGMEQQERWIEILENSSVIKEALPDEWSGYVKAAVEGMRGQKCWHYILKNSSVIKETLPDQWQGIIWIAVTEIIDAKWWGEILHNPNVIREILPNQWEGYVKEALEDTYPDIPRTAEMGEVILKSEGIGKGIYLSDVKLLNDLHASSDAVRFASVEGLPAWQYYDLITYGAEEAYTSTYNGLFTRMISAMKRERTDGLMLFRSARNRDFRQMISKVGQYNRLNELLHTLPKHSVRILLERFVESLEKEPEMLKEAIAVADLFGVIKDKKIIRILQDKVKTEYERVSREGYADGKAIYGLLAGLFGDKAKFDHEWFGKVSNKYRLPRFDVLSNASVRDTESGICTVRFYFYKDDDGEKTQENFITTYGNDAGWKIKDSGSYYVILSTIGKLELYANKYDQEDEGNKAIDELLGGRKADAVIHRGHSYHAKTSIRRINEGAKLVYLGSCGGYNSIVPVLDASADAQILTTKGKGTKWINDPLIKLILDDLAQGKDIIWPELWNRAGKKYGHNEDFENYISPHMNLGVVFVKAYKSIINYNIMINNKKI